MRGTVTGTGGAAEWYTQSPALLAATLTGPPDTEGSEGVYKGRTVSDLGTVSAFFLKWRTEHKDYNVRKEISEVVTCKNASGI